MDIEKTLNQITQLLFKDRPTKSRVTLRSPSENSFGMFNIVLGVVVNGHAIYGSSSAKKIISCYIKAICELGESQIYRERGWHTRSGLAGGLVKSSMIDRAKGELLERDAFLFHYRTGKPFMRELLEEDVDLKSDRVITYEMASASPRYFTTLSIMESSLSGVADCLIFSLGSGLTLMQARRKSVEECSAFFLRHRLDPNWCSSLSGQTSDLADRHHYQSKDLRNMLKMKSLCSNVEPIRRALIEEEAWQVENIPSPLRLFKYVYVRHPELIKIEFGKPESNVDGEPLYHPFW